MGSRGQSFSDRHDDLVMEMKRKLMDFVKSLQARREMAALGNPTEIGNHELARPEVRMTERGYPILPHEASSAGGNKRQLEHMMRAFLTQHYCELLMDNYRGFDLMRQYWRAACKASLCRIRQSDRTMPLLWRVIIYPLGLSSRKQGACPGSTSGSY